MITSDGATQQAGAAEKLAGHADISKPHAKSSQNSKAGVRK